MNGIVLTRESILLKKYSEKGSHIPLKQMV